MLTVCIEQIRARESDSVIHVMSYSPNEDIKTFAKHPVERVFIHSQTPKKLVLSWFPWMLICLFLPVLKAASPKKNLASPRALLSLDGVFDLAGVSFMDGREKFLPFNMLTLWPFLFHKIPVYKMSQAMGSLRGVVTRASARLVLPYVRHIFTRGDQTQSFLDEWKRDLNTSRAADMAFLLEPEKQPAPVSGRSFDIAFVPSSLVQQKDASYKHLLAETIGALVDQGIKVSLVVHSWRDSELPRNNDYPLALEIQALVRERSPEAQIEVLGFGKNSKEIKSLLAEHKISVSSRFHGMIASLNTATPCVVLGWSHKYKEVLAQFGQEDLAVDRSRCTAESLSKLCQEVLKQSDMRSSKIAEHLPLIRQQSQHQFEKVFGA